MIIYSDRTTGTYVSRILDLQNLNTYKAIKKPGER